MSYPTMTRTFFERAAELTPVGIVELHLQGRGVNGTYVRVTGANTLTFAGTPAYVLGGPVDPTAVPIQLGYEKGDLIRIIGPLGTEANHNKLVTLLNPATGGIWDTLTVDSPVDYYFNLIKRRTFVLTNRGREWLANLMSWKSLDDPPAADDHFYQGRLRFVEVGQGTQDEIRDVATLVDPWRYDSLTGLLYLKELDPTLTRFPNVTIVRVGAEYDEDDLSYDDPVLISEAGLFDGESPASSGSAASAVWQSGTTTLVTGLTGMLPLHVGLLLNILNGDNDGYFRITRFINETSVEIERSTPAGADTGNPTLQWEVGQVATDAGAPCVTYMTFEGISKVENFGLGVYWELRI